MAHRALDWNRNTLLLVGLVAAIFLVPRQGPSSTLLAAATWFVACLLAEAFWHRATDDETVETMSPAAHLAAVAVLPPFWSVPTVVVSAVAGSVLWRRWPIRRALLYGACVAVASAGAILVLMGTQVLVVLQDPAQGAVHVMRDIRHVLGLLLAGLVFLAVVQGGTSWASARRTGRAPFRVWREAFGYETDLVTSGAIIIVGMLAVLCYDILAYRGILLCVMPLMFVRDGSRRFVQLELAQGQLINNERLAAKGEMAAEIGHELNNYLAAISGRAQLLARHLEGDEGDEILRTEVGRVRDLATRMAELAKGLMDFSHREVKRTAYGVNELVEKTVDFVRPQTKFRGMEFTLYPAEDLPPVEMDPGQIQQVLLTLLGRVARFSSEAVPGRDLAIRTFADERRRTVGIEISWPPGLRSAAAGPDAEAELGLVQRILDRHRGRLVSGEEGAPAESYRLFLPAA
jgi:signal transduction histidine kinase